MASDAPQSCTAAATLPFYFKFVHIASAAIWQVCVLAALVMLTVSGILRVRSGRLDETAQQRAYWAQNTIPVRISRAKLKWVARCSALVQPLLLHACEASPP